MDDLSFSPDGRLLASNLGGIARLWEVTTDKEVRRFVPETEPQVQQAERALLSPDGKWLAAYFISPNERAPISLKARFILTGNSQRIRGFSRSKRSSNKGKSTERSVGEIWDVVMGKRVKAIELPREWRGVYTVAFSPDATLLAIGGYKKFGIFSIESGELLVSETHHHAGFSFKIQTCPVR